MIQSRLSERNWREECEWPEAFYLKNDCEPDPWVRCQAAEGGQGAEEGGSGLGQRRGINCGI